MTGRGGWPMTVFLTPDGRPFFGGTYFPPRDAPRHARASAACSTPWTTPGTTDATRSTDRPTRWPTPSSAAPAARRTSSPGRGERRRPRRPGRRRCLEAARWPSSAARFDPRLGRVRARPEVPPGPARRAVPPPPPRHRRRGVARHGHHHPGGDGRRRDLRPPRRRLRPLLHRRHLDGAALREDALRPGRAGARLPARLAGHRRRLGWLQVVEETIGYVLTRAGLARRRAVLGAGRRLRGRRGPLLRVDPGRDRRRRRARARRRRLGVVRGHRGGQLRGPHHLAAPARRRPRAGRPTSKRPGACLFEARAPTGPSRARRQGAHRVERHVRLGAGRGGRRHRAPGLGGRRRCAIGEFLLAELRAPRRRAAGCGRGRTAGPATSPTPATTPGSSSCSPGWPSSPGEPLWLDRAHDTALAMLELFAGEGAPALHHGERRRAHSWSVPWTSSTAPCPPPTASPPPRCSAWAPCAADDELTDAGESLLGALASRSPREHPLACANSVAACALAGGGITEVVITGDRPDLARHGPGAVRTDHGPRLGRAARRRRCGPGATTGSRYVCRRYVCQAPAASPDELAPAARRRARPRAGPSMAPARP